MNASGGGGGGMAPLRASQSKWGMKGKEGGGWGWNLTAGGVRE